MKGYKGFSKGLICRGKQYAENTVYEEDEAKICKCGMHFCANPFDVWRFYPPTDEHGNLNEFAEVEAEEAQTADNIKYCTKKLKIGAKLSLSQLVRAGVEFLIEKREGKPATNTGVRSAATNTGDYSAATNTGDGSAATNTGDYSATTNTGFMSAATNTGDYSAAMNTGECSAATNTGIYSVAINTGVRSAATNTGIYSVAINTGDYSAATSTEVYSVATNTGDYSAATNTGNWAAASVEGMESIAIVTGKGSKAKGAVGDWLVLTERDDEWHIMGVKAVKVTGRRIKADTLYVLKDGQVMEVQE